MKKGSWGDSFWAALPHLLIALLVGITGVIANAQRTAASGMIFAVLFLAGFFSTIYYTWRQRWPAWSASWYGYAGLVIFIFAILPSQGWQPPLDRIFGGVGSILLLLLGLAALLYWLTRRNPIEGLLMALPLIILYWFPITEFIPVSIRTWLIFGLFLISAMTAMTIIRINDVQRAIWIVLGASVLGGLPIAYARTYLHNIPMGHFSPPTIGQMIEMFSVQFLAGAALAIGPILGWGIRNIGKRHGQAGRMSAGLVIFGALVNLFGQFSYWRRSSHLGVFDALGISFLNSPDQVLSTLMVYAGLFTTLIGVLWIVLLIWHQDRLLSISLIFVPLVLPLFAMFPVYFGYHIFPPGLSFEFVELSQIYRYLIFLVGTAWLVMSGWTVTRLYNTPEQWNGVA